MIQTDEQSLHRLIKMALDNGTASTVAEARSMFDGYALNIVLDGRAASKSEHQIALLTAVALARRVFLGGVHVSGPLDTHLAPNLALRGTIGSAVSRLGATLVAGGKRPTISIADGPVPRSADFHARPVYVGWRGATVPGDDATISESAMPLAPLLGAALAVSEAFAFVADQDGVAGRRSIGLSLWNLETDWSTPDGAAPLEVLPSRLWLIGLGHLGQAYLWALGMLPYPRDGLHVVLQDTDIVTRSTESTSVLTDSTMVDHLKTRVMASWAEERGFRTRICERSFDSSFRLQADEPPLALCGVDNATARRALDHAGFSLIVEAGLGHGHRDFRSMRLHTLPGAKPAEPAQAS